MKEFNGKAIYKPKGKAGEYAEWACNFYNGCSNGCEYCYLKKGVLAHVMGGDKPTLKKCFKDEAEALKVFEKELKANLQELQKHGLFFSFTTDPMLPETKDLTINAIHLCCGNGVPVKILTKRTDFSLLEFPTMVLHCSKFIAFGFTLTGHDELEQGASTNAERIDAMKKLHDAGFKTFASIEPIIDLDSSWAMICNTSNFCDLYKIGLESGKKYDRNELQKFAKAVIDQLHFYGAKIYFKDSILKQAEIERSELYGNCVERDYNLFDENV